jgi:hypothetical protein
MEAYKFIGDWLPRLLPMMFALCVPLSGSAQSAAPQSGAPVQSTSQPAQATTTNSNGATPSAAGTSGTSATQGTATPARNVAGTINLVDGQVNVTSPDKSVRTPKVGDRIYEGDTVNTVGDSELHVDMADGGFIAVRPNSQIQITHYQANGDSSDRSAIGLFKGSLRSITGWIGKFQSQNYVIRTPTATIGVRGTDHEPAYLEQANGDTQPGTYDTVHEGGTTLSTKQGSVDVTPDHAGYASRTGQARVLDHVPAFYNAPHRHDDVFVGKHAQVLAGLASKRDARKAEHAKETSNRPAARGGLQHVGSASTARTERGSRQESTAHASTQEQRRTAGTAAAQSKEHQERPPVRKVTPPAKKPPPDEHKH